MSAIFNDLPLAKRASTNAIPIAIADTCFLNDIFSAQLECINRKKTAPIIKDKIGAALHESNGPISILDELTKPGHTLILSTIVLKEALTRKDKKAQGATHDGVTGKYAVNCDPSNLEYEDSKLFAAYLKSKLDTEISLPKIDVPLPFLRYYDTVEQMIKSGEIEGKGKGGIVVLRQNATAEPDASGIYDKSPPQAGDLQIDAIIKEMRTRAGKSFFPVLSNDAHFAALSRTLNGHVEDTHPFMLATHNLVGSLAECGQLAADDELEFKKLLHAREKHRREDDRKTDSDLGQLQAGIMWLRSLQQAPDQRIDAIGHHNISLIGDVTASFSK